MSAAVFASALGTATTAGAVTAGAVTGPGTDVAIQPGSEIFIAGAQCTANFVFDGVGALAGKVYVGTAAHCVHLDDEVSIATSGGIPGVTERSSVAFGRAAFVGDESTARDDYAFIEVYPAYVQNVRPEVKGHPSSPTGVALPAGTTAGDLVEFSGYGLGFGLTEPTRENRFGPLVADDSDTYAVAGPVLWGDSGGPAVHDKTDQALGVVSRLCVGSLCWVEGPTVAGTLTKAWARGFTVALRTVPSPAV